MEVPPLGTPNSSKPARGPDLISPTFLVPESVVIMRNFSGPGVVTGPFAVQNQKLHVSGSPNQRDFDSLKSKPDL